MQPIMANFAHLANDVSFPHPHIAYTGTVIGPLPGRFELQCQFRKHAEILRVLAVHWRQEHSASVRSIGLFLVRTIPTYLFSQVFAQIPFPSPPPRGQEPSELRTRCIVRTSEYPTIHRSQNQTARETSTATRSRPLSGCSSLALRRNATAQAMLIPQQL